MNFLRTFLYKYVFSDELPLAARRINIVCITGLIATLISLLSRMLFDANLITFIVLLSICILIIISMYVTNKYEYYKITICGAIIIICYLLFPALFLLGGMISGMPAYFVLGIVILFLFMEKKLTITIMTLLQLMILIACYITSFYFPEYINEMTPRQRIFDNIQAITISSLFIGFVILFQKQLYNLERKKNNAVFEELIRHDELLRAVNKTATVLLTAEGDNLENTIHLGMAFMVKSVNVDRMSIWQNIYQNDKMYYKRIYGWHQDKLEQPDHTAYPYGDSMPWWTETLSMGNSINSPIVDLPEAERKLLSQFGISSILVIPITLNNFFWGFVTFDDCKRSRIFSEEDLNILKSGSLLLVNTILRNDITDNLIKARHEAENASMAKSEFLSNMSHEIRTPINAITGMTTIAKKTLNPERKDLCLEKIEEASTHLLGIINDILDMSKIEANKLELSAESFNFEKMLQKVVNVTNFKIDQKQQQFTVKLDKRIPTMLIGDDQRLAQVITNLLSNAAKFTPEHNQIMLNASLLEEVNKECTLQIEVIDSGIGITDEQQKRLFNSFEQADSSTSRKFGGTGLGLAISKRIVELMGGTIWVKSTPNVGSTFAFTVKLIRDSETPETLLNPNINWKNVRVLAVDDDYEIAAYFSNIANKFGINYDIALNDDEAVKLIEKNGHYDIYFVDWFMEEIDGIQLSKIIKERDSEKSLIIMITSGDWSKVEQDAKNAGVYRILSKPLFPSTISDIINECLGITDLSIEEATLMHPSGIFEGYQILLVEDVEINREIVMVLLEPTKLSIDCAVNGKEAVRIFSENPKKYDMIFMDVQMPEMDGYTATRTIREINNSWAKQIPIVAMTANVFREDIDKCLESGMNNHAGKPLNFDEIIEILKKYLPVKKQIDEGTHV